MESAATAAAGFKGDDLLFLAITAAVAAGTSLAVFVACFYWWFRRERRRLQKEFLHGITEAGGNHDELFLTGRNATAYGELVAQFKVNHGKQVVSVLESDGNRFIHVDGELSSLERAKMVRYLKSEGFMS